MVVTLGILNANALRRYSANVLVVVVVMTLCMDLAANLAGWKLLGVDVPIDGIGFQRGDDCSEIASGYVLCRGAYNAGCGCHPGYCHFSCRVVRAGLSARWTVIQIRAKEHRDPTTHMLFSEMDVRLRDVAQPGIRQSVAQWLLRRSGEQNFTYAPGKDFAGGDATGGIAAKDQGDAIWRVKFVAHHGF